MTAFGSTVELMRLNASGSSCSQRGGHRFRTKPRAARVGNEARGSYDRTERQAQACVGYTLAVREGSSPAMHAVMAGRVSANARTRGMPCRAGLGIMGKKYASVAKSTTIHAPQLEQWEAASNSHLRQCSRSAAVTASCCMEAAFHRSK
jgi:hypothetical protein